MASKTERHGYRGYIGSRPYNGDRVPQHVQNLVIRDYCQRNGFTYLLSATEYAMTGCYMMLDEVMAEAPRLQGVVLYSLFMLPRRRTRRLEVCKRILDAGTTIHGAVENMSIRDHTELDRIDNIVLLQDLIHNSDSVYRYMGRGTKN